MNLRLILFFVGLVEPEEAIYQSENEGESEGNKD